MRPLLMVVAMLIMAASLFAQSDDGMADQFLQCVADCCTTAGGTYDMNTGECVGAQGDWTGCPEGCLTRVGVTPTQPPDSGYPSSDSDYTPPTPSGRTTGGSSSFCCAPTFLLAGLFGFVMIQPRREKK